MIERYILTGTPGSGKTAIIRALERQGYLVIEEAASSVIAYEQACGVEEPWQTPTFIEELIKLQKKRQIQVDHIEVDLQFFDRSPICTYALAQYLGFEPSDGLMAEIERIQKNNIYQKEVFFIENIGFLKETDARKISFEESLIFEKIHLDTYKKFGYECVKIPAGSLLERVEFILLIS